MGCGESKHAVSTENVLTKTKSKAKSAENNPPVVESANSDGDVNEPNEVKENEIPDVIKKEEIEKIGEGRGIFHEKDGKEKGVDDHGSGDFGGKVEEKKEEEGKVEVAAVDVVEEKKEELKGEEKKEELKGGKNENVLAKKDEEEQEKLIQDDSSKETIETIVSDGVSRKSENDSPGKSDGKDAVEGKEKDEEANLDAEKEEVLKIDEGKNVVQVDETKVSVTKEEKTPAEDENAKATSTNDVKEN
ncbi:hypothetical protein BUALT_Bualt14G0075800 [Buddleja alternifolia]|uniref:Uncharacterized protein n=1 Tax=Buddleja alternifolia TaxID=168488 RepID=A0AAV6WST1_9LAMI|nr:hypothetical protein BUALT_Bualt14G0075800 [Buddleja alternifolia]